MSILFTSCWGFEEVDMGYPQSVNFTKDGGEKIVTTDKSKTFISASVIDYNTANAAALADVLVNGHFCHSIPSKHSPTAWGMIPYFFKVPTEP